MNPKVRLNILRALVLVGVIALTVVLYIYRSEISKLQGYGYVGIFLVSILANGTIIIPLPGVILTSAMASAFNPFWLGIAAGAGAAFGELTGYMAGFSGQAVIESNVRYNKLIGWMRTHRRLSDLAILVIAFIPNPFFDLAGMASGALKIPLWRFLPWVMVGKICKMWMFAYGGASIIQLITKLLPGK